MDNLIVNYIIDINTNNQDGYIKKCIHLANMMQINNRTPNYDEY